MKLLSTALASGLIMLSTANAWSLKTYKSANYVGENPTLTGSIPGDNCHPVPYAHKSFKWDRGAWPCFFNAYSTSNCASSSHIGYSSTDWNNPSASGNMKGFKFIC